MEWDDLLRKIRVNRKPMSVHRLQWWLVIILTRLFGRRVKIENSNGQTIKIFPVVWGGKLRLLGSERDFLQIDYTSQYTARVRRAPDIAVSPGRPIVPNPSIPDASIIHVVVCHLPPAATEIVLRYIQSRCRYTVVLAYGGPEENFGSITWPHKVFVDDPLMRGFSYRYSYGRLIPLVRDYLASVPITPEWVFITDYDLLPMKDRYLEGAISLMTTHQAGFAGKIVRDISLSNSLFLMDSEARNLLDDHINGAGKAQVFHCIGALLFFHWECFNSIFRSDLPFHSAFLEMSVPTDAARQGFRILSFDQFIPDFEKVRYRPVYSVKEAAQAAKEGAQFIHPIKDTAGLLDLLGQNSLQN